MSISLGEAVLKMVGDSSKLSSDLNTAKSNTMTALGAMGSQFQKTGLIMSAAISLPLAVAADKMMDDASDLNETTSKIGIVFEDQAARVEAFGNTAAKSMGMSKNAALTAAGNYGNLFDSMEIGAEQSADMSMSLVQLAADLASFNNQDPTEVLGKLQSGLVGESEPLKSLGININEAIIKEKALELGLYSGTGAVDSAAKAQAVYALMFQQTSKAQGDFERTSEGAANKARTLEAQLTDMSGTLGNQLLPIKLKVITALSAIIEKFTNMSPAAQKVILVVLGIVAVIGPLLSILGTVMTVVSGISAFLAGPAVVAIGAVLAPILPIIAIIAAVIAVIALLYAAWKNNWFGIRDTVQNVIGGIVAFWNTQFLPAIQAVSNWIGELGGAFDGVKNAIIGVWDWLVKLWDKITNIKLPDWMTPGSPTPWEIGLRGVADAMGQLDENSLPGLSAALGSINAQVATPMQGQVSGPNAVTSSKNVQFTINNPVGETTDESMNRGMNRLQYLGMA